MRDARELVAVTIDRVTEGDRSVAAAAGQAMDRKTKPRGSLGRLEDLVVQIAAIRREPAPGPLAAAIVVAAGDHGIAAEGVSAYPQEVTAQMVRNFATGGAAICVLARRADARLVVVDAGLCQPVQIEGVLERRIGAGTANSTLGPAMSVTQAFAALGAGIELVERLSAEGIGLVGLGEMGIGNTTAACALTAALLGRDPGSVCGRGTGIDDAGFERKVDAVRRALAANRQVVEEGDPVEVLAAVGGFEIGLLAGVVLGGAAARIPIVLDGYITASAALVASRLAPTSVDPMIASHRSTEPGHAVVLEALGLDPLLVLRMRLGEGSGAALAIPIVNAALAVSDEMATFEQAGVTDAGA